MALKQTVGELFVDNSTTWSSGTAPSDEMAGLLEFVRSAPALDTPAEAAAIMAYSRMIRLVSMLRRNQTALSAELGMQVGDLDILFLLQRAWQKRQLRVTDLANMLQVTPGGISKRIDRLVAAGLVSRETTADDRRAYIVTPTEQGRKLAEAARLRSGMEGIPALSADEWAQLDHLIGRLAKAHGAQSG